MEKYELTEEEIRANLLAIIEDSRKNPWTWKPVVAKCSYCLHREPDEIKCRLYPDGIPKNILVNTEACPEFEEK